MVTARLKEMESKMKVVVAIMIGTVAFDESFRLKSTGNIRY